jgi:tetratricopeptide (TPR) repeat protein
LDTDLIFNMAEALQSAGQLEESAAAFRKTLDLNPEYTEAHAQYAMTLTLMGKQSEALAAAQREPDAAGKLAALACVYWAMGRRAESDSALSALERGFADRDRYPIAAVHAYRGEADAAFNWLERAYQQNKGALEGLRFDPVFRQLHGDPRFVVMLRKANLSG